MKTNGKLALKGMTIVVAEGKEVKFDAIEIEYEASFSIHEMIQALDVIDIIPDKLAGAYRKFLAYEEEFGSVIILKEQESKADAPKEAETTEEKPQTAQSIADTAEAIVGNLMKDLLKDDVETSEEASATAE
jgi:hypothetical protein